MSSSASFVSISNRAGSAVSVSFGLGVDATIWLCADAGPAIAITPAIASANANAGSRAGPRRMG